MIADLVLWLANALLNATWQNVIVYTSKKQARGGEYPQLIFRTRCKMKGEQADIRATLKEADEEAIKIKTKFEVQSLLWDASSFRG